MKKKNLREGICVLFEGIPDEIEIAVMEKRYNQITCTSTILFIVNIACIAVAVILSVKLLFDHDNIPLNQYNWLFVLCLSLYVLGVFLFVSVSSCSAQRVELPQLNCILHTYYAYGRLREFKAAFENVKSNFTLTTDPISIIFKKNKTVCISLSGETKEGDVVEREVCFPVKSYTYNTKISLPVVDMMNGAVRLPERR